MKEEFLAKGNNSDLGRVEMQAYISSHQVINTPIHKTQ